MGDFNYNNLWNIILDKLSQPSPQGYAPVKNVEGAPKNYFMKPDDMVAVLNAFTPYDLALKPNKNQQYPLDYGTSAFNINNLPSDVGIPNAILQALGKQQNLGQLHDTRETANQYPQDIRNLAPNGIYQHEVGHYLDPRLNPYRMWSANNYGNIQIGDLIGGILQRELPAMKAEDKYLYNTKNKK